MRTSAKTLNGLLILILMLQSCLSPTMAASGFSAAVRQVAEIEELPPAIFELPKNNASYSLDDQGRATVQLQIHSPDNSIWEVEKAEFFSDIIKANKLTELAKTARANDRFKYDWTTRNACVYNVVAKIVYKHRTKGIVNSKELAAVVIVSPFRAAVASNQMPPANGIYVGQTKVFDERSLALKLQSVEASLANRNFYDQTSLAAAIGKLQGAQQNTSSLGISVTGLPVPGVTTVDKSSLSEVTKPAGTETTKSNSTDITTTEAAITPSAPALPSQTPALTSQLAYNVAAQDLLAEQMSLTHQVINLRTLLERALSDRVSADTANAYVRKSAVVGFQISLDPQKIYKNAVAEVDITVTSSCPTNEPSSLVALFPKDKTYNVATITKNAKQFGFGAVLQVVNVGASYGQTKDTFYLVRDTDTIALERAAAWEKSAEGQQQSGKCGYANSTAAQAADQNSVTFGWQFRPVLKRKFVEPGTRQVFAILSLPKDTRVPFHGSVEVRTRWREFNPDSKALGRVIDCSTNIQSLNDLVVTPQLEEALQPVVKNVNWQDAGQGLVTVTAGGDNFFPGTSLMAGNVILSNAETGLLIADEHNLRFVIPAQKLAQVDAVQIFGRFGPPTELLSPTAAKESKKIYEKDSDWGIKIPNPPVLTALDAQNSEVKITLKSRNVTTPANAGNPAIYGSPEYAKFLKPLIIVGGRAFGFGDSPVAVEDGTDSVQLTFTVPTQLLKEAKRITVKYPFWGDDFTAETLVAVENTFTASKVSILSSDDQSTQILISGSELDEDNTTILVGKNAYDKTKQEFKFLNKNMIMLNLSIAPAQFAKIKQIIVRRKITDSAGNVKFANIPLIVTSPAQPSPKPKVLKAEAVYAGDSKVVKLEGANFNSIQEIRFEGRILAFELADDGATLKLSVPGEMTVLAGDKAISFVLKDGAIEAYALKVERR